MAGFTTDCKSLLLIILLVHIRFLFDNLKRGRVWQCFVREVGWLVSIKSQLHGVLYINVHLPDLSCKSSIFAPLSSTLDMLFCIVFVTLRMSAFTLARLPSWELVLEKSTLNGLLTVYNSRTGKCYGDNECSVYFMYWKMPHQVRITSQEKSFGWHVKLENGNNFNLGV